MLFFSCHNTDAKLQQFSSFTTGSGKQEVFPVYCDMKNEGMAVLNKYICSLCRNEVSSQAFH